jgi:hypothetical protein
MAIPTVTVPKQITRTITPIKADVTSVDLLYREISIGDLMSMDLLDDKLETDPVSLMLVAFELNKSDLISRALQLVNPSLLDGGIHPITLSLKYNNPSIFHQVMHSRIKNEAYYAIVYWSVIRAPQRLEYFLRRSFDENGDWDLLAYTFRVALALNRSALSFLTPLVTNDFLEYVNSEYTALSEYFNRQVQ